MAHGDDENYQAVCLNFANDSVIAEPVSPETFLAVAQCLSKALGIAGTGNPRLHVIEDLSLDAFIESAQIPFDPRIVFNYPGQGSFAVDSSLWVLAGRQTGIPRLVDPRSLRNNRSGRSERVGQTQHPMLALRIRVGLRFRQVSRSSRSYANCLRFGESVVAVNSLARLLLHRRFNRFQFPAGIAPLALRREFAVAAEMLADLDQARVVGG
jgi:hypothetical protein